MEAAALGICFLAAQRHILPTTGSTPSAFALMQGAVAAQLSKLALTSQPSDHNTCSNRGQEATVL